MSNAFAVLVAWLTQFLPPAVATGVAALLVAVVVLWLLELVDFVLGGRLNGFGIRPRSFRGLVGIPFAPLLHGGFGHLLANTLPLLVLGGLIALSGVRALAVVTGIAWLTGGLGAWLFGRSRSLHIGASGIVFGYLGFLLGRALFEQSLASLGIAVLAAALYGGALWGVLPLRKGRSWQCHLFGLLGGLGTAWQFHDLLARAGG